MKSKNLAIIVAAIMGVLLLVAVAMAGCPSYRVYTQTKRGEASLKRAEYEKQILVIEGEARLKQAEYEKQILVEQARAEVDAAGHRTKAIQIVGEMAKKYPEYRYQEFIGAFADALSAGDVEKIIYVPTESNIPIVEAGRALP